MGRQQDAINTTSEDVATNKCEIDEGNWSFISQNVIFLLSNSKRGIIGWL